MVTTIHGVKVHRSHSHIRGASNFLRWGANPCLAQGRQPPTAEKRYAKLFTQVLDSKSYQVQGAALQALPPLQSKQALTCATAFEADNKGALTVALVSVYGQAGGLAQWPSVLSKYDAAEPNGRFDMLPGIVAMLGRLEDPTALPEGIPA